MEKVGEVQWTGCYAKVFSTYSSDGELESDGEKKETDGDEIPDDMGKNGVDRRFL